VTPDNTVCAAVPTITVFIPENLAPLASWFESAIHDELSHVLGAEVYKKHGIPREHLVNAKAVVIATNDVPTIPQ